MQYGFIVPFGDARIQSPRIPIWVVGAWPRMRSMRRVLRWDGLIPTKIQDGSHVAVTPDDTREMAAWIAANRSETSPFDIVQEGQTPGANRKRGAAIVQPWVDAGVTWWLESRWSAQDVHAVRTRIKQGPPRFS